MVLPACSFPPRGCPLCPNRPGCRPDGKQWLKFDDERVEKADDQKAVEDNWGGEDERPPGGEEWATAGCSALLAPMASVAWRPGTARVPPGSPALTPCSLSTSLCGRSCAELHLSVRMPRAGFGNFRLTKHANAYMLVYVRESEWATVMCEVTEQDISDHVRARLKVGSPRPRS